MSKTKLITARELIKAKRYDDARSILIELDDPTARKWLDELDRIAPKNVALVASKEHVTSDALIAGVSSTVIIATISIILLVTFFLAIYAAFLRPTAIITAQQMPIQQESLQTPTEELVLQQQTKKWEYLTVTFNGTFEGPFCYPTLCQLPANEPARKIAASTAIGAKDVCTSEKAGVFSLLDSQNQTASRWGNVRGERHKDDAPRAP